MSHFELDVKTMRYITQLPFAICRNGNTWLQVGSNPKVGRDLEAMFGSAYMPATYATKGAAKRIVTVLEARGVTGLEVCDTPVPLGPDEDVSDLIEDV